MVTKTIINGMKLVFALALVQAPFISPQANAACKPKDECQTKFDEVAAHDAALGATSSQPVEGQSNQGNKAANAGLSKSAIACPAVDTCKTKKKECDAEAMKKPKPLCQPTDCEEVEKQVVALTATCATGNTVAADGAKTQTAAESKGTGAGGEMMGALLGAAMGVGMAMLMNQEEEEEIPPMPEMPYNGALQPNGTIDCSKPDSFQFRDCNTAMEARCMTMLDDPSCQQFSARYCGHRGGGGGRGARPMTPPGVVLGVNPSTLMGSRGEGVATQYCKNVLAWNFCKPRGRESCPSCAQIAKNQSPACAQDPALCLAQNSPSEIEKAKLSCPTDPAFSDPNYAGGTGTQPPSTVGGSMPAVILPQSVSGADGSAGAANREGYANGPSDSAYSGNGSSSGVSTSYSTASVGGRELAQLGGGAAGFKPSNMGGPASDVEGQYGPSLFTTSTQVIRKRCQAGKLKNCP